MADSNVRDESEIWKPIPSMEEMYSVSNKGRVRSEERLAPRLTRRGNAGYHRIPQKILKPFLAGGDGYLTVCIGQKPDRKKVRINRLVCEVFHGEPKSPGDYARHLDGNKFNNRAENLAWGTPKQNSADRIEHNTVPLGSKIPQSKLTEADIPVIRSMLSNGISQAKIASQFGVTRTCILAINLRKTWYHVP